MPVFVLCVRGTYVQQRTTTTQPSSFDATKRHDEFCHSWRVRKIVDTCTFFYLLLYWRRVMCQQAYEHFYQVLNVDCLVFHVRIGNVY